MLIGKRRITFGEGCVNYSTINKAGTYQKQTGKGFEEKLICKNDVSGDRNVTSRPWFVYEQIILSY